MVIVAQQHCLKDLLNTHSLLQTAGTSFRGMSRKVLWQAPKSALALAPGHPTTRIQEQTQFCQPPWVSILWSIAWSTPPDRLLMGRGSPTGQMSSLEYRRHSPGLAGQGELAPPDTFPRLSCWDMWKVPDGQGWGCGGGHGALGTGWP